MADKPKRPSPKSDPRAQDPAPSKPAKFFTRATSFGAAKGKRSYIKFSQEIADEICERLASGEKLRVMCATDADLPSERCIYRWLVKNEEFQRVYETAHRFKTMRQNEDIEEIADDPAIPADHKRVMIDARKWSMATAWPKKYGQKAEIEHGVADSLAQLMQQIDGRSRSLPIRPVE